MLRATPLVATLAAVLAFSVGWVQLPTSARAETSDTIEAPRRAPFDRARGTLPWPVAGLLVVGFGQPTGNGGRSGGIAIEASLGAVVVSPCSGMVVYAGVFKTYGDLVIIAAGDGYHCLLAGPLLIDAEVGQQLSAGDPIGTLIRSKVDGAAPRLRLELLKNSRLIDPVPWLRRS
jgi:septal ring factor EnvC (AmiA/AmiB activator)